MSDKTLNHLKDETSPYLLEHADNPVDWYPWSEEALDRALDEDKPIFLSIGYSACHWCHVMKRESFEDRETAELLNKYFVNIKVDREERPDLDEIYMQAVQSMTGRGGWPMSVFLTPERKPFYGGTYFPDEPKQGMPSFKTVIQRIHETYENEREDVKESAEKLSNSLSRIERIDGGDTVPDFSLLEEAHESLSSRFDSKWGGFGDSPKFPRAMDLQLLCRLGSGDEFDRSLDMLEETLDHMMGGGIYDQIGGGFARYSTDREWLVPHFEKMLYDNAQLIDVYTVAYRIFDKESYGHVVRQSLRYVHREMTSPDGAFYSTQNAESEGEEGKYYVWDYDEFVETVEENAELMADYFGVTTDGNFEGKNILHRPEPLEEFCESRDLDSQSFRESVAEASRQLLSRREQRIKPERDEKILTDWNGLMAAAHARAGFYFDNPDYLSRAENDLQFLREHLVSDGVLHHVHKDGTTHTPGFLDDYAFYIKALLEMFQATGAIDWLKQAKVTFEDCVERFWDEDHGGFYFTDELHRDVLVRSKNPQDKAQPSGNSEMVLNALKLAGLTGSSEYRRYATETLGTFSSMMEQSPAGLTRMLCGLHDYHLSPIEVVSVDDRLGNSTLLDPLRTQYIPNLFMFPASEHSADEEDSILLEGRLDASEPTSYVCSEATCREPAHTPDEVRDRLQALIEDRGRNHDP